MDSYIVNELASVKTSLASNNNKLSTLYYQINNLKNIFTNDIRNVVQNIDISTLELSNLVRDVSYNHLVQMIQNIDISNLDITSFDLSYTHLVQMIQNIDLSSIDLSGVVRDASFTQLYNLIQNIDLSNINYNSNISDMSYNYILTKTNKHNAFLLNQDNFIKNDIIYTNSQINILKKSILQVDNKLDKIINYLNINIDIL